MEDNSPEAPPRSVPHEAVAPKMKQKLVLFLELFAGKGRLSYAVRAVGGTALPPEDYMTGGFDFRKAKDVENLKEWFTGQVADAVKKFLEKVKMSCVATVWKGVTWKERLEYFQGDRLRYRSMGASCTTMLHILEGSGPQQ